MATTTVAASSGGANAKGKLVGKDYITLAIFGVLLFLVFMVFAMVLGMNANLFWFTHACGSLIGGIVWMYVAAKVPKRGAFAIMSAIVAVVALLLGMLWTGPVGIVDTMSQVGSASPTAADAAYNLLTLAALIAVNLAVMNLLPIPALDGGRVLFLVLNGILHALFRKKIPAKYEGYVHFVGLAALLTLSLMVAFSDVGKIIGI